LLRSETRSKGSIAEPLFSYCQTLDPATPDPALYGSASISEQAMALKSNPPERYMRDMNLAGDATHATWVLQRL